MFAVQKLWLKTYNFIETSVAELMDAIDITGSGSTFGKEAAALGQARIAAIDRQAQATKTAREKALEGSVNAINYDLEQTRAEWAVAVRNAAILAKQQSDQKELQRARSEWAMAVQTARNSAQVAADQPNTANIAAGKFTELIKDLKTGEIATRVDKAVQSAGPAQDLRTAAGSSAITRILNQAGTVTAQQQKILLEQRDIQRRLLAVTERGALAYQV
jgi:predicted RNA methylase